jgi:hypothetical protein
MGNADNPVQSLRELIAAVAKLRSKSAQRLAGNAISAKTFPQVPNSWSMLWSSKSKARGADSGSWILVVKILRGDREV